MKANVVIDLEMCRVYDRRKDYPYKSEIIQIGAVMLNEAYEIIDTFSMYVKPRYGKINYYILALTGISERTVKDAPDIEDALNMMIQWIGDKEVRFYSWSPTDFYQMRKEISLKCGENSDWSLFLNQANWIDYQERLGARLNSDHLLKLTDALLFAEIDTQGRLHDGFDDAYNTALLISKLEIHKDYQTLIEKIRAREEEQKPLTVSMGCFMQGITLASA